MNFDLINNLVIKIKDAVTEVRKLVPGFIMEDHLPTFNYFDANLPLLQEAIAARDAGKIYHFGINTCDRGEQIGKLAAGLSENNAKLTNKVIIYSRNLRNVLRKLKEESASRDTIEYDEVAYLRTANESLKGMIDEQQKHEQRIKKSLSENEFRITDLEQKLKILQESAESEIGKITSAYSATLIELESKKAEIDRILGHVSGRAVAGDYEKSATEEKRMADWLRWGSLGCMALIAFALGSSLFETFSAGFDWQKSIFRVALGFLLSVPAAYLARESAKHREQQYQHQQTSLDLKAISPFMASLPEEEQHKIKIQIASRVFAGRDFSKVSADPFPLNTQEIIIELIKKLEIPKHDQKAGKPTSSGTAG